MRFVLLAAGGTLFTFLMTALGASLVFFFKSRISDRAQKLSLGFASGVMLAAAVFSLLVPAAEQTREMGGVPWLVVTAGLLAGSAIIAALDAWMGCIGRIRRASCAARKRALFFRAVTLHNIPEGMAVGLAFALAADQGGAALAAAATLAFGIGVQNLPEGAAIALPLRQSGMSRLKSFTLGALSGAVEPIFGVLVVLIASAARAAMPPLMAVAAGAMLLVIVEEMLPEAASERYGTASAIIGFALMMALDIALG